MIFRSHYPDVVIPDVLLTPFVLRRAKELADKPALVDGPTGRTLSFGQLAEGVQRVAAGLARRGFQKGDVFAICLPNLPEYFLAFHAVASLGGVNTTVNPLYTIEEIAFQLNDASARYLLTVPPLIEKAVGAAGRSKVQEIFVVGEAAGATSFASLLQGDGQVPSVSINPREDVVVLPYSSGTTGRPKGVMLTHRNLVATLCQAAVLELDESDVVLGVLPFFHIYGLQTILNLSICAGATVVTMPRFDLEPCLQIMQGYGVTRAYVVPPIALALAKHPMVGKYSLAKLRLVRSGGAPLDEKVAAAAAERLACPVVQGYGLTETSPIVGASPNDPARIKAGSVGLLVPNTACKIVDLTGGEELAVNQPGEICVCGPQVMKGYLNRPEATAATIDAEGWLHTGDVGYVDGDGYFYLVDRVKELIKYKGMQVAPAELEAVLLSHPAIADAAVIPSPDEEAGEVPKAFVVRRDEVTAVAVMAYIAERVAPYKKVRRVEFVDQIPKSPSGKILRRVLVERERAVTARTGGAR